MSKADGEKITIIGLLKKKNTHIDRMITNEENLGTNIDIDNIEPLNNILSDTEQLMNYIDETDSEIESIRAAGELPASNGESREAGLLAEEYVEKIRKVSGMRERNLKKLQEKAGITGRNISEINDMRRIYRLLNRF